MSCGYYRKTRHCAVVELLNNATAGYMRWPKLFRRKDGLSYPTNQTNGRAALRYETSIVRGWTQQHRIRRYSLERGH